MNLFVIIYGSLKIHCYKYIIYDKNFLLFYLQEVKLLGFPEVPNEWDGILHNFCFRNIGTFRQYHKPNSNFYKSLDILLKKIGVFKYVFKVDKNAFLHRLKY